MGKQKISQKVSQILNQLNVPKLNKAGLIVEGCNPGDSHVRILRGSEVLYRVYNESREIVGFSTSVIDSSADRFIRRKGIPVDYDPFSEGLYRLLHDLPAFTEVGQNYQRISLSQFLD